MDIVKIDINLLNPAPYNPRLDLKPTDPEYIKLKNSIQEFGYVEPIVINKRNNVIIGGHQRYKVLKDLGYKEIDVVYVDLDDIHEKSLNIALNKISGDWDADKLEDLLREINLDDSIDTLLTGFDINEIETMFGSADDIEDEDSPDLDELQNEINDHKGALKEMYGMPPFSVFNLSILNTRDGDWTKNNRFWKDKMGNDSIARSNAVCMIRSIESIKKYKLHVMEQQVSILDPTLCEIINRWFCPKTKGNKVFDTFAGDLSYGFVSTAMENYYTGIELRQEQVDYNSKKINDFGYGSFCNYICDDALNVDNHIDDNSQDLYFNCPPYFDLEVYSDKENDASNQKSYDDFIKLMETAWSRAIKKLKNNRFAVVVAGDIRGNNPNNNNGIDKSYYIDFLGDIKRIFKNNGMRLYNELILVNVVGNGYLQASPRMKYRKVIKVHQNVLVFYKGDISKIKDEFYDIKGCYKEISELPIFKDINNSEDKEDDRENME